MDIFPVMQPELFMPVGGGVRVSADAAWENGLVVEEGRIVLAEEEGALESWIARALKTRRGEHPKNPANYGSGFSELAEEGLPAAAMRAEVERLLKECLLQNPCITGVREVDTAREGSRLRVSCRVETVYGDVEVMEDV